MASSGGKNVSYWQFFIQLRNILSKNYPTISHVAPKKSQSLNVKSLITKKNYSEQNSSSDGGSENSYSDIKSTFSKLNSLIPEIPSIFSPKKIEGSTNGSQNPSVPKWVSRKKENSISKASIDSRTRHLVKGLELGLEKNIYLNRIEGLCMHLKKYPNTKGAAIKSSGISRLLNIIHRTNDTAILESARLALALMGYTDPVKAHGVRILSIDGGGVRGLVALELLQYLESATGKPVHKLFDFICGVSTGAIVAILVGVHRLPLEDCKKLYRNLSSKIFSQSAIKGTASLVWKNSFYDSQAWSEILKTEMGEQSMIDCARQKDMNKLCLVSSLTRSNWVKPFLFRNYEFSYRVASYFGGSSSAKLWEATRASAAAPGYFSEFKWNDLALMDGGVLVNNPTAIAIHEARHLWPDTPLQSVVSIGTGRHAPLEVIDTSNSWSVRVKTIINSATDTEGVHNILHDLLPGSYYFRLNPYLSENVSLDETAEEKITTMLEDTSLYLRKNEVMLDQAVKSLSKSKTIIGKVLDTIALQRHLRNL